MNRNAAVTIISLCLLSASSHARSEVPPALQSVRRHMLDADVNALTFHNMEQIFDTRRVDNQGPVLSLPASPRDMSFTYVHAGKTYTAEEALERTYTNALLIVKDGKLVTEIYRNKTDAGTHFVSFSMAWNFRSFRR